MQVLFATIILIEMAELSLHFHFEIKYANPYCIIILDNVSIHTYIYINNTDQPFLYN